MTLRMNGFLWALAAIWCVGLALFSYRYLPAIGPHAPLIVGNPLSMPWLYLHVVGAATGLLLAPFNLLSFVRARWPQVHRWVGRVYIVSCLVGGVGGLVSAFGSTAGPIATAGFASLAVCWIAVNGLGWRAAWTGRFIDHRAWMIRSFALTLAAVTLRLYMPLLEPLHIPILDGYRAISFLCWVPNLIVAELYIRGALRRAPVFA